MIRGDGPILLAQPHGGTFVPEGLRSRLNENGQILADTDWHISDLYDDLLASATVVRSNVHRYVIDANRDPSGVSLYPGQNTTTLCPTTDFDGKEIWKTGQEPSDDEIEERRQAFHAPYHAALSAELDRTRARHGIALLFDCHSIRSRIPFLFDGQLPVFNIGTNGGRSCAPSVKDTVAHCCFEAAPQFDTVLNGRFKGGWTTRHYGLPEDGIHALQMELSQRAYMIEKDPWSYQCDRAKTLRPILGQILKNLDQLARQGGFGT